MKTNSIFKRVSLLVLAGGLVTLAAPANTVIVTAHRIKTTTTPVTPVKHQHERAADALKKNVVFFPQGAARPDLSVPDPTYDSSTERYEPNPILEFKW